MEISLEHLPEGQTERKTGDKIEKRKSFCHSHLHNEISESGLWQAFAFFDNARDVEIGLRQEPKLINESVEHEVSSIGTGNFLLFLGPQNVRTDPKKVRQPKWTQPKCN